MGAKLLHSAKAGPAEGTFSVSVSYLHFDLNTKFPTPAVLGAGATLVLVSGAPFVWNG
jgi:hypothetical protein